MDRTLTSFIWAWITLILLVNIFGIVGLIMSADSGKQALHEVQEIYSLAADRSQPSCIALAKKVFRPRDN